MGLNLQLKVSLKILNSGTILKTFTHDSMTTVLNIKKYFKVLFHFSGKSAWQFGTNLTDICIEVLHPHHITAILGKLQPTKQITSTKW